MAKVLFVGTNDLSGKSGGSICSMRNYDVLVAIFGEENIVRYELCAEKQKTIWEKIRYYWALLFRKSTYHKISISREQLSDIDLLYVDNAYAARCISEFRKQGLKGKIIVFFHNCEYDFRLQGIGHVSRWKYWLQKKAVMHNESLALAQADACIFLTARDYNREKAIYGITPKEYVVCPITMHDAYHPSNSDMQRTGHTKPIYTFVGSYFGANIHALQWFMTKVLPHVNITLRVVGKNMNRLKNDIDCSHIEIYSDVADVAPFVLESDYMLFPLFEGSGMKVKTCEALMYAKNIVATPEAFTEYQIGDYSRVGACCEDDRQFIAAINSLNMPPYNSFSRELFLTLYDFPISVGIFRQLVKKML